MKDSKGVSADGWEILQNALFANPTLKRKVLNHIKTMKKKFAEDRKKAANLNKDVKE